VTSGPFLEEDYSNSVVGFSIAYPTGWNISEGDGVVQIEYPSEAIVVLTTEQVSGVSLADYMNIALGNMEGFQENSRIQTVDPPGQLLKGRITDRDPQLVTKVLFTMHGDYAITVMSGVDETLNEEHEPTVDAILDSLQTFSTMTGPSPLTTPTPTTQQSGSGNCQTGTGCGQLHDLFVQAIMEHPTWFSMQTGSTYGWHGGTGGSSTTYYLEFTPDGGYRYKEDYESGYSDFDWGIVTGEEGYEQGTWHIEGDVITFTPDGGTPEQHSLGTDGQYMYLDGQQFDIIENKIY
jgi:hypothetical protein